MHTRDYSDDTARVIDEEVERILREQEERCRQVLSDNRNGLDLVARALLEHETIDGSEVTRLIELGGNGSAPPPEPTGVGSGGGTLTGGGFSATPVDREPPPPVFGPEGF